MVDMSRMADLFRDAAEAAGRAILALRGARCAAYRKADSSPVTDADHAAEGIIIRALNEAFPATPFLAEEACAAGHTGLARAGGFFLIDPLDGTREFVAGRDEFTVNIAYVEDGRPLVGVVHAPALRETYLGHTGGAWRWRAGQTGERIAVREAPPEGPAALVSRSHLTQATQAFLNAARPSSVTGMGSSIKFCRLAEGAADLYPCLGPTMEWDTAAGEAVLRAAGGDVRDLAGSPLVYGRTKEDGTACLANPHFVAVGRAARA